MRKQINALKADNLRMTQEVGHSRVTLSELRGEINKLNALLEEAKGGAQKAKVSPARRISRGSSPREHWPPLGGPGRDGSQSAPVLATADPLGLGPDAGAFILQQMEESIGRIITTQ